LSGAIGPYSGPSKARYAFFGPFRTQRRRIEGSRPPNDPSISEHRDYSL